MEPNRMYHLFFIPPFQQCFDVLKLLKHKLLQWSDRTKRILTFETLQTKLIYTQELDSGQWSSDVAGCSGLQIILKSNGTAG